MEQQLAKEIIIIKFWLWNWYFVLIIFLIRPHIVND
jgi:hypothetical protein